MIKFNFKKRIFRRILNEILKHEKITTLTMSINNDTCIINDKNVEQLILCE